MKNLAWAISGLEQLVLLLRTPSSADDPVRQHERHFARESLHALVFNFNANHAKGEGGKAPDPEWDGKRYLYKDWLLRALAWLDKVITAMRACQTGDGQRVDFTLTVGFCAAWHTQCSDSLDEEELMRKFVA